MDFSLLVDARKRMDTKGCVKEAGSLSVAIAEMSPCCIKENESVRLLVHTGGTMGINQAFRTDSRQPLEKDVSSKLQLSFCKALLGT